MAAEHDRRPMNDKRIENYIDCIKEIRAIETAINDEGLTEVRRLARERGRHRLNKVRNRMSAAEIFRAGRRIDDKQCDNAKERE